MSFPTASALAGLAWYLTSDRASSNANLSFIAKAIQTLPLAHSTLSSLAKWAFGISSIHYVSSQLTEFARNNWRLGDAHRWNWKEEIAVVTGGCSGIGEEIVKALASKGVKVVIMDVSDMPERLKEGEYDYHSLYVTSRHRWSVRWLIISCGPLYQV
jgi:3-oxoacyl-ACP reductase-like protein